VKRPLERRCGGGWRVRRLRDRVSAIRTHTRGAGRKGRGRGGELTCTGRRWSASLIHLQRARPCRPVPFFVCASDSAPQSRPEALDSLRRPVAQGFVCDRRLAFRGPAAVHACCGAGWRRKQNCHPGRANLRDPGPRAAGVCGCGAFGEFTLGPGSISSFAFDRPG
jgi:hypothetical protein